MAGVFLSGCVEQEEEIQIDDTIKETIKIGFLGPLSGDVALYGVNPQKGALLAIDEINSAGGINGHLLELISEDSKCNPSDGITSFNKLLNVDNINFLIGGMCSSVTLAISPSAVENKVVVVSPVSTNYLISYSGDYIFRTVPSDALQGKKGAEIAYEKGYRKAAVFYVGSNDYGEGLKKVFEETFKELGGEVIISESHLAGDKDFRTQLLKIKSAEPEVLYLPAQTQEVGLIVKQLSELEMDMFVIGTETMQNTQFLEVAGDAAEGVFFTSFSSYDGETAEIFSNKYKMKYNEEEIGIYSDYAYDAIYAIANAMKKCESITSECVKKNLYESNFVGATGQISFDKYGDVKDKDFAVFKVENGSLVVLN
jgi:branched-chain amino acid transport system substrate-binding protein